MDQFYPLELTADKNCSGNIAQIVRASAVYVHASYSRKVGACVAK